MEQMQAMLDALVTTTQDRRPPHPTLHRARKPDIPSAVPQRHSARASQSSAPTRSPQAQPHPRMGLIVIVGVVAYLVVTALRVWAAPPAGFGAGLFKTSIAILTCVTTATATTAATAAIVQSRLLQRRTSVSATARRAASPVEVRHGHRTPPQSHAYDGLAQARSGRHSARGPRLPGVPGQPAVVAGPLDWSHV